MKKLYSFALACVAAFCCAPQAGAQLIDEGYDVTFNGIYYRIVGEMKVEIVAKPDGTKYKPNQSYTLAIPQYFDITTYVDGEAVVNSYFVVGVADNAFEGCDEIRYFDFPEAVTSLGAHAFKGCTMLKEFNFSNSPFTPLTVGEGCFEGCDYMGSITLGSNIGSIGSKAFEGCSYLDEVTVLSTTPPGSDVIASDAFQGLNLSTFTLNVPKSALSAYQADPFWKQFGKIQSIQEYSFQVNGVFYLIDSMDDRYAKVTYDNEGDYSGDIVIPSVVESPSGSLYKIREIYQKAFRNCTGLTSVTLPETVTSIGINCFQGCSSLKSIVLPPGINQIPDDAFNGCSSLESITLPAELYKIFQRSFQGCSSLKAIDFSNSPELYLIGANSFKDCSSLADVTMNEKLVQYGMNCFEGCTSLKEFTFPAALDYLDGSDMFMGCTNLERIRCLATTPAGMYQGTYYNPVFTDEQYETVTLEVPKGCKEAYEAETLDRNGSTVNNLWRNFANIVEAKSSGIGCLKDTAIESDCAPAYYNMQGVRIENPQPGTLVIRVQGGKAEKLIIR